MVSARTRFGPRAGPGLGLRNTGAPGKGNCMARVVAHSGTRRWFQLYLVPVGMGAHDLLVQDEAAPRPSAGHLSHPEPRQRLTAASLLPSGAQQVLGRRSPRLGTRHSPPRGSPLPFLSVREPNPTARLTGAPSNFLSFPPGWPRAARPVVPAAQRGLHPAGVRTLAPLLDPLRGGRGGRLRIHRFQPPRFPRTAFSLLSRLLVVLFLHWGTVVF